ncbi:PREDICTED: uncharacterized protein LOC105151629 isoform X2 [Acromyrmex echinatior]|uniref:Uncharacterized protein n=1 Tax=Acromyrmex echinatior TaxID=103372 RepID=F4X1E7_ACREC|nr:PREDICTED: uncharacterized protein LOC105151629 isoform X2 [Acromyrmex echinatior]EGI59742.1 hypothetical protein G5I_12144 [Acromyrmex echinatior]
MFVRGAFCALCTIILFLNVIAAEWVDMPQFSDETKVYRIPSVQHNQFYKFRRGDTDNINFPSNQRNGSQAYRRVKATYAMNNRTEIKKINFVSISTTPVNLFPDQITDNFADIDTTVRTATITDTVTENKLNKQERLNKNMSSTKDTMVNTLTIQPPPNTEHKMSQDKYNNDTSKRDDGIFQYLPIDILKSVHHTLQSQPASVEGKLYFLKTIEKTLMSEIESRLTTTMAPSRKIRGVEYYGHDDHEDHSLGFPSIEGTLMAISFLTFAVYLVRLVMLLLRNINTPTTTTTAATVFLGKRKRSTDLDDDTARILNNINSFVPDL